MQFIDMLETYNHGAVNNNNCEILVIDPPEHCYVNGKKLRGRQGDLPAWLTRGLRR
jgi:hypothetical protein